MSEAVENDYVATATAEKRLREVLAERFGGPDGIDGGDLAYRVGDVLLAVAEITYLPRKKSVSITLRVPETAATPKPSKNGDGATTPPATFHAKDVATSGEPAAESATESSPPVASSPRPARFGLYEPTVTSAPEYHDDDYFTE